MAVLRILVLENPVAGRGRAEPAARALVHALGRAGADVTLHRTAGPDDAGRVAAAHEGRVDRFVIVGGDGTVAEVLNAVADPGLTPLAQLACGTANLLARELGIPLEPEGLARVVLAGRVRRLDLAHAREVAGEGAPARDARPPRRFLLLASCGFDARVVASIGRRRRSTLGFSGYLAPIARALRDYRPPALRVRVDGGPAQDAGLVIATKIRNYGGLFRVSASASPDAGRFEVLAFASGRVPDLARYLWAARRGRVPALPDSAVLCGTRVRIEADGAEPVEVDGDGFGSTPVELDLVPRVVPVLVPEVPEGGGGGPARSAVQRHGRSPRG
jgi:diacylglycerol kinase family enzyme